MVSPLPDADARDFAWEDGERLIRFGELDDAAVLAQLERRALAPFVLFTGRRAPALTAVSQAADEVVAVPGGPVPEAAADVRGRVSGRPIVALGGGRVIDAAKAIAGADGLRCAAVPTTLSGAEMTGFHRMPAGVTEWRLVRPELVVAIPSLMASQPMPDLAASAMNALAHAMEALYTPMTGEVARETALRAAGLIASGLGPQEPEREPLALGAVYAGYASGVAGIAVHHAVCQTIVRIAGTPHAQTNAVMLPHSVRFMQGRASDAIGALAHAMGAHASDVSGRVAELAARSEVSRLSELGVEQAHLAPVVAAVLEHPALGNTPGQRPDEAGLRALVESAL